MLIVPLFAMVAEIRYVFKYDAVYMLNKVLTLNLKKKTRLKQFY